MTPRTGATEKAGAALAPPASMASRFRQRLFQPWSGPRAPAALPDPVAQKKMSFQASIAEFLLVNRLRARKRAAPSADVLERASRIVYVTCQNWFATPQRGRPDHRTHL
ncbi:hypothetical protein SAMN05216350_104190 [Polaromonas sp. YR568]|uniref:hypothetical protein n=1 Tax=Polaromonas sp. YR568 TaxID=1855301 RepID=UPI0008E001CE|nr:hypothetical protein [Polaromonas sp. YR568]SFU72620.1 hypothetical protein SAMN05216350_104190 [Polaromonas sp. YR568]